MDNQTVNKPLIYLVVGVPGSGKSWCCEQLTSKFLYLNHDGYVFLKRPGLYVKTILEKAKTAERPLLIEAPFGISDTVDPLVKAGYKIIPHFIIEKESVLRDRYFKREGKPIPIGHITRMATYKKRAMEGRHFMGTSQEVYEHLRNVQF